MRSYEIVGGPGWYRLLAIDLAKGEGIWWVDLGADPISTGGTDGTTVWLVQAGTRRVFDAETGREKTVTQQSN